MLLVIGEKYETLSIHAIKKREENLSACNPPIAILSQK